MKKFAGNGQNSTFRPARILIEIISICTFLAISTEAQVVQPNPSSTLKSKKVLVLEGGSISGDHLASRTATWANLQAMAMKVGFSLTKSDAKSLTETSLTQYDIVVFNYFFETHTETAFPTASKNAFQAWLAKGKKGYVGYHTSGANEYSKQEWLWYQDNVTFMRYALHGSGTPQGTVDKTTDATISGLPIMQGLPARFTAEDEWYEYENNSKIFDTTMNIKVMYYLTNAEAINRAPNPIHPVAWFREDPANRNRYFYSTFVHGGEGANTEWFKGILLRALEYVAGEPPTTIITMNGDAMIANRGLTYISNSRSLHINIDGDHTLAIYSASGKLLSHQTGSGSRTYHPQAFLQAGIYTVRLESKHRNLSQRVMVY